MKTFYMVLNYDPNFGGHVIPIDKMPTKIHSTHMEANQEADRLVRTNPHNQFVVLQAIELHRHKETPVETILMEGDPQ